MIGSHDTFTYLTPACKVFNPFERLWRTQCKSISEQYEWGVRFFDIRVCRYKSLWAFAHGLVTFPTILFPRIEDICKYIEFAYPLALYRLVLEKGDKENERQFVAELANASAHHKCNNLWLADIKKNKYWRGQILNRSEILYQKGYLFTRNSCTWTLPNYELHGKVDFKNILSVDLKAEARHINTQQLGMCDLSKLQDMYENPNVLYLLDYCTNEYD